MSNVIGFSLNRSALFLLRASLILVSLCLSSDDQRSPSSSLRAQDMVEPSNFLGQRRIEPTIAPCQRQLAPYQQQLDAKFTFEKVKGIRLRRDGYLRCSKSNVQVDHHVHLRLQQPEFAPCRV